MAPSDPSLPLARDSGASLIGPLLVLVLGACAMGLSPIFVRLAAPEVGPFASAFWRVALALPFLFCWMRFEGSAASTGPVRLSALLAGAAFAGDLIFWHLSIMATTVANATFFATTAPIFVILATWLVLRRHISWQTVAGLVLCIGGGGALVAESMSIAPGRLLGDAYGVVTAVFFAAYLLFMSRARERGGAAARITFVSSLVTAAILLVVALLFDRDRFWATRPETWAALLGLAFVSQVAGQGLLAVALGRLPTVFSSLVIFLEAVFAAGAGWIVLGEALSPVQYAGGALILVGIVLARPRRVREKMS